MSRFRSAENIFCYGKLRRSDYLPCGEAKDDQQLERGALSEESSSDEESANYEAHRWAELKERDPRYRDESSSDSDDSNEQMPSDYGEDDAERYGNNSAVVGCREHGAVHDAAIMSVLQNLEDESD